MGRAFTPTSHIASKNTIMKKRLAAVLLVFVLAQAAMAQETKFRGSPVAGGLPGRYLVSVTLQPGENLGAISRQLAADYGVRIELYAAQGFTGFAIVGKEERERLMSGDPRVVAVTDLQRIETPVGAPGAAKKTTAVRQPSLL